MPDEDATRGAEDATDATKPDRPGAVRARPRDEQLQRGTLLGRYVVLDVLGAGGMGVVYAAYDPELDRKVAVKLLQADVGNQLPGDDQAWLQREAQAMARVTHPNVISVFDVGTLPGHRVFIAMELVQGQTLRDWLRDHERRSWREVLPLLRAAGEGLAAAHAAGLVHRDFKPANVLIDAEGRVRVMDFGLARLSTSERTARGSDASLEVKTPLSADLTTTGQVVGTPAYMAPELFEGSDADVASDQFSFGAALYEALYGARPFDTPEAREPKPPPAEAGVPASVHEVVLRALSRDPGARYPSMKALLADLAIDPDAKRRRLRIGALAVALVGVGVAALVLEIQATASQCDGAEERLGGVWSPSQQQKLMRTFAASGRPDATAVVQRVAPIIDQWAAGWQRAYVGACEDTRVRRVQSDHLLDLRMACLTRRLDEAGATISLLAEGGGDAVDHALEAARGLPSVDACGDVAALTAAVAPPASATAGAVAEIRAKLDEARARSSLGRYAAALELAQAALARANAVAYPPAVARAQLEVGALQHKLGNREAGDTLSKALTGALAAGDAEAAVQAAVARIYVLAASPARFAVADELVGLTDAIAQRASVGSIAAVKLDGAAAYLLAEEGKLDPAKARYERALAVATTKLGREHPVTLFTLRGMALLARQRHDVPEALRIFQELLAVVQRIDGPDHPDVATALDDVANCYAELQDPAKEKSMRDRALAIRLAALGPDHPEVAHSYNNLGAYYDEIGDQVTAKRYFEQALAVYGSKDDGPAVQDTRKNLATVLSDMGDRAEARRLFEGVLASREKAYGADDPRVAEVLLSLGETARQQKKFDEALDLLGRAHRIMNAAYGPNDQRALDCLGSIAATYSDAGRLNEARETTTTAVAAIVEVYGPDDPTTAIALANQGLLQLKLEDAAGALANLERAGAIFEARLGPDHPNVASALTGAGQALIKLHRSAEAATRLERAIAIATAAHVAPADLAEMHYWLAVTLVTNPASRTRAIAEARVALEGYQQAHSDEDVARVKSFLQAH